MAPPQERIKIFTASMRLGLNHVVFDAIFVTGHRAAIYYADSNRELGRFHQRQHVGQRPVGFVVNQDVGFGNAGFGNLLNMFLTNVTDGNHMMITND